MDSDCNCNCIGKCILLISSKIQRQNKIECFYVRDFVNDLYATPLYIGFDANNIKIDYCFREEKLLKELVRLTSLCTKANDDAFLGL